MPGLWQPGRLSGSPTLEVAAELDAEFVLLHEGGLVIRFRRLVGLQQRDEARTLRRIVAGRGIIHGRHESAGAIIDRCRGRGAKCVE